MIENFEFASNPHVIFGSGKIKELPNLLSEYKNILLLTGNSSFKNTSTYQDLIDNFQNKNIYSISLSGEPSPQFVDETVTKHKPNNIEVVVSIGGGSVVDAGKAISAMLLVDGSVMDYLEGFMTRVHPGTKVPFIAIPTSSGTGSEMTKNAVLSNIGEDGFKKSLRHNNFIPNISLIDPYLTLTCSKNMTVACGLDAFTQLLEAYVSTQSSPITDALALSGIEKFAKGFLNACNNGDCDLEARENMSYASMMSGVVLANAGLGTVHGFASPMGGYFDIPHGIVCATLLPPCTKYTIWNLLEDRDSNIEYLNKYSKVGEIISNKKASSIEEGCNLLISTLYDYLEDLIIPTLSSFGICKGDFDKIIKSTNNKYNPSSLSDDILRKILLERL